MPNAIGASSITKWISQIESFEQRGKLRSRSMPECPPTRTQIVIYQFHY